ncbi:MAG: heparinase II/III family protein [Pirellulaceae bacterium]|nr:heparinase II/III family protein [Pirellulaceae bacterium]
MAHQSLHAVRPAPAKRLALAAMVIGFLTAGGTASLPAAAPGVDWIEVAGAKIPVPPPEHPRLYLRPEHVAQLPARLRNPVLQPVVTRLESMARRSPQSRVEWDALQYLVQPDRERGRATIGRALDLLKRTELADRQDACRETGRMMVTGAIVYDWLHPLLTADDKQAFVTELIRLAKTQECGYPPTRQGSVTGHSSEAMIMRDMISAGIAIYDEDPEMYRLAAGRFFREHLPARNWLVNGHAYHQGDSYGAHRYSWDTYPLWIFDRLGAGNVYNPEQRFVPYLWVYTTRPDGQRLRAGDTFMTSRPRGQPWSEFVGTLFTASYYGDGTLLSQFLRQGGSSESEAIFEFLWRDTRLQAKPLDDLPLSRYFGSPFGWMVARTGWEQDAAIAEMKINEYNFVNHQHLDAGAFQIYYRGALAIDSGLYSGSSGAYGSPHCQNYYWRTIAHNSLLVYDPDETFGKSGYGNDGGQRLAGNRSEARTLDVLLDPARGYRTGQVLAHGFGPDPQTPDFTLLEGDITAAYSSKVRQVVRSFVFLNLRNPQVPAAMVVFDRVVSSDPAFRKYWLLHTQEEPRIEDSTAVVDCTRHDQQGRLLLDVLLPAAGNRQLTSIGGPGREFWVFGTNFANDTEPGRLERSSLEPGAWRIELSPGSPADEDLFLTAMQVTDRTHAKRLPVRLVELSERVGALLERPDGHRLVLFRRDAARSPQPVTIDLAGLGTTGVLVAHLAPGRWRLQQSGSTAVREIQVTQELGAAWFEATAGTWRLAREEP